MHDTKKALDAMARRVEGEAMRRFVSRYLEAMMDGKDAGRRVATAEGEALAIELAMAGVPQPEIDRRIEAWARAAMREVARQAKPAKRTPRRRARGRL